MLQDQIKKQKNTGAAVLHASYSAQKSPAYKEIKSDLQLLNPSTLKTIQSNFLKELEDSMSGHKTSLPFILHSLSSMPQVRQGETFQTMVIGGSAFKQANARMGKDGVIFSDKIQEKLPIMHTKNDFTAFIERHLDPTAKTVGINFAYPLGPVFEDGRLDGVLLSGVKEHSFTGVVGERVGKLLEEHFWKKYKRKVSFSVANDTVCLLLSGLGSTSWDNLACGIVGTGVNFAFFITASDLVNLESANFDKFPVSKETKEIDRNSAQAGRALFEKETAGAYLYQHFNSIIKKQGLPTPPLSSTWELKQLAIQNSSEISRIATGLIKKSAALVATQIGGIVLFKNRDMAFVMDGSFFWDEDIYRKYVEDYLRILIPGRRVVFISVPDSSLLGAAKLIC